MVEKADALYALHEFDLAIECYNLAMEYDSTLSKRCNKSMDELDEVRKDYEEEMYRKKEERVKKREKKTVKKNPPPTHTHTPNPSSP